MSANNQMSNWGKSNNSPINDYNTLKKKYENALIFRRIKLVIIGLISLFLLFVAGTAKGFNGILFTLFSPIFIWFIYTIAKKPKPPQYVSSGASGMGSNDHGSAKFTSRENFQAANFIPNNGTGIWIGNGIIRNKQGHIITVAGSGQGKGTCLIIPNLLKTPIGSYVVTDPKGENAFITARSQQMYGQKVYILDPWNEQEKLGAIHDVPSSGFNPFDFIKHNPFEIADTCEQIANFLIPDKPDVKDPYWNDRGRSLIKALLMHIVTNRPKEEHNFWTLYKMLRLSGKDWISLLFEMKENGDGDNLISISADEFLGLEDSTNTIIGIKSTAQNATKIFESPQLRQNLNRSDFNPYNLTDGNCTVYIVIPERFIDTHSTWLRLVIGLCLKACNSRPNKRVQFMLDEFAIMGKMKDVQRGFAFARGQNINLWIFAQSLSQLKEIYGEDGMENLLSNAAVLQGFGIKDKFTKEYFSKSLGETTWTKTSSGSGSSTTHDGLSSSNYSLNSQTFARSLLTPEEVETTAGIISICDGLKYIIQKEPYYKNPMDYFEANSSNLKPKEKEIQRKKFEEQFAKQIEIYNIFMERADPPPRLTV